MSPILLSLWPSGSLILFIQQIYLRASCLPSTQLPPSSPQKKKKKNQGPTVIWSCLHHYPDFHFPVLFHFYQWWGSPLCFICLLLHCTIFAYSFIPLFLELVLIFLLQTTPIQVPSNPNSYGRHILWILFPKAKPIIFSSPTDLKTAALLWFFSM